MARRQVRVLNTTRGTILAERADLADSFWTRARGLLGRSSLAPGEGLVIVPAQAVHCVGMAFPIDVVHVREDGRIVKVVTDLRPYRFGPIVWRSHYVVELPTGTAIATLAQPGDLIELAELEGPLRDMTPAARPSNR